MGESYQPAPSATFTDVAASRCKSVARNRKQKLIETMKAQRKEDNFQQDYFRYDCGQNASQITDLSPQQHNLK